jgi:hypothetical protein
MAFGQQSGPPASSRQVHELLTLLMDAGHADFRDARGPMGFTQRQAAGKFTRDEATGFIDQLQEAQSPAESDVHVGPPPRPEAGRQRGSAAEQLMRRMPAAQLADELKRRGWTVVEP